MMDGKKNLLFISTRAFWHMDGGHQYEIYHYLRGLHDKYNYRIFVYTFVEDESANNDAGKPDYIEQVEYARQIKKSDIVRNVFSHMFNAHDPWPLQNMLFYSATNAENIKRFAEKIKPHAIYVDMMRLAPYVSAFKDIDCLKVLGYDDLLSERYRRQISLDSKSANVAGAYSDRLPSNISKLQSVSFIKKAVLRFEAKRMGMCELYYAGKYDSGIFVSAIETQKFNERLGRKMAHTVSMGIDYAYQSEKIDYKPIPNSFSYVGNMKTAANYETVTYIIEQILPYVKTDYKFYVIGTSPAELVERYKGNDRIIFTGRVDDLRPYIKATSVFLSPIAFGTGIKTKILEAFAMGMPVLTNSVGIEGIEAENGVHCFISDAPKELADKLDLLLKNEELRKQLSCKAQELSKEKYQWERNWNGFAEAGF